jgi:hypothetical protein
MGDVKTVGSGPGALIGPSKPEDVSQGEAGYWVDMTGINMTAARLTRLRTSPATNMRRPSPPATNMPLEMPPRYRINTSGTGTPNVFPRQFTFVGDTDHRNIEILGKARDILKNFAASGGQHVVFETDSSWKSLFESIKNYKELLKAMNISENVSFNDFIEAMPAPEWLPGHQKEEARAIFADIMQTALDNEMVFHAQDKPPYASMRAYADIVSFVNEAYRSGTPKLVSEEIANDSEFAKRYEDYIAAFVKERLDSDENMINYINKIAGNEERVMFLYGASHADHIEAGFGHERCQCIFILGHENEGHNGPINVKYSGFPMLTFPDLPDNAAGSEAIPEGNQAQLGNIVSKYNNFMISTPLGLSMAKSPGYQSGARTAGAGTAIGLNIWGAYGATQALINKDSNLRRGIDTGGVRAVAEITNFGATGMSTISGMAGTAVALRPALREVSLVGAGARLATPIAVAATVYEAGTGYVAGDAPRVARATGAGAGAFAGAATLGLAFAWTGPGALVAAAIGGIGGAILGGMAGEAWLDGLANYVMNMTGKDTGQRADSDIAHVFGPGIADRLASIREELKAFDNSALVRDMAMATQAGEQGKAVYFVLLAELLRREQVAKIEQAKASWSANVSLTADKINAMTIDTIYRLQTEGKITVREGDLALSALSTLAETW